MAISEGGATIYPISRAGLTIFSVSGKRFHSLKDGIQSYGTSLTTYPKRLSIFEGCRFINFLLHMLLKILAIEKVRDA
ncbi:MAG: hypothetical protein ACKO96_38010, partial [Flammeovirgaceae bacterium]